jgi:hypothetical protein
VSRAIFTLLFASLFSAALCAQTSEAAQAIERNKLTAPGSFSFHLKATVKEPLKKDSAYKAEIEEYWASPDRWRRTIKSAAFSQTLVASGGVITEQHTGDYYPAWIRKAVTALFDLSPEEFSQPSAPVRKKIDDPLSVPMENETSGSTGGVGSPSSNPFGLFSSSCRRWETKTGTPPAQNKFFNNVCVQTDLQLLTVVDTPSLHARFNDFQAFKEKQIARTIVIRLDSKTSIEVQVNELSELHKKEDAALQLAAATAPQSPSRSVLVEEAEARKLLQNRTDIAWAPVHEGKPKGVLTLMVYADKEGRVRETAPVASDNWTIVDQAREAVSQWHFQPLQRDGTTVQMDTILTLPFETTIVDPIPLLSNEEARKLAIFKSEPTFKSSSLPHGTAFTVRITVNETGTVVNTENIHNDNEGLYSLAASTVSMWRFKPYKINGKPTRFNADLVFYVE